MRRAVTALAGILLALFVWIGGTLAQQPTSSPDYAGWSALAQRAEEVVEAGRASDAALEVLRADVAAFRDRFLAAQTDTAARITTVQSQLTALGPRPEDGSEPPEIAERRAELEEALARVLAPVRLAEEAHSRASGIIAEIDRIVRTRQTDALLELGPSPLNPVVWPQAVQDIATTLALSWQELRDNLGSPQRLSEASDRAPAILLAVVVALVLLVKGPNWVRAGVSILRARIRRGRGLASYVASLGLILVPLAGIFLISVGVAASGLLGPRWTLLIENLPGWAMVLLGIRWLAEQCFSDDDEVALIPLTARRRSKARAHANVLAWLVVADGMVITLTEFDAYSAETLAVVHFPLLVLSGFFLHRLGRMGSVERTASTDTVAAAPTADSEREAFRLRMAHRVARAVMAAGVLGPLAAAIGYRRMGDLLVNATVETLSLIGIVLVLHRLLEELYYMITGNTAEDSNSLWPVLGGWVLLAGALPVAALIWGARSSDLSELWTQFREGFSIGETRISPTDFLTFAIIFAIGYTATRLVQGALRTSVLPKTSLDIGGQTAIVSGVGYVGVFLAALIAITTAGIDLSGLAIVAGALSVGIGFGLQTVVSNFVSGIILLIERPIAEGDWIEVGGQQGHVRNISVRSTRIETFDRTDVIVPNADLVSGTVTNYTRGNTVGRVIVPVGVAYGTDTRLVETILREVAEAQPMVLLSPPPSIFFVGFGADALEFEIRAILRDVNWVLRVKSEMNHEIARRFGAAGIEIPFAQRDIWLRNPDALRGMAVSPEIPADDGDDDTADDAAAPEAEQDGSAT